MDTIELIKDIEEKIKYTKTNAKFFVEVAILKELMILNENLKLRNEPVFINPIEFGAKLD
jgi:hypothetical protein